MLFETFDIPGLIKITPHIHPDARGVFMETYRADLFATALGGPVEFVQDNHSVSLRAGTLRGLHFQSPPYAQGKLVRCTKGALLDVAVDIRAGSPTYGQHVKIELSEDNAAQLWVPCGFLHGFVTLLDDTDITYKCTNYYSKSSDGSVLWNDPDLAIDWGIDENTALVSEKDARAQLFEQFASPFIFV